MRVKSLSLLIIGAVILSVLQPRLSAQVDDRMLDGAQKTTRPTAPSAQDCQARVNDTPEKLLECIQPSQLWKLLAHFQEIANNNREQDGHGYRDTGTPGYLASVDFVQSLMEKAGYQVTVQSYQYTVNQVVGVPEFATPNESYVLMKDWAVARHSGGGTVNAPVRPAGFGCFQQDFSGFAVGSVALLERGTCSFDVQVANAQAAGAAAVVIYNSADASKDQLGDLANIGDSGVSAVRLLRQARIPVVGVASYRVGSQLLRQYKTGNAPEVHIDIRTQAKSGTDYNLIAESPYGDVNHTVVIEGHLDSIYGAGMLDNASGSTTILAIALQMANTPTRNRLRYIWFGGEELGLLGSTYYTEHLTSAERKIISFDLDADVTATPNYDIYVADPATACNVWEFPSNVVPQSRFATQLWADYFKTLGLATGSAPFGNCGTDSNSFSLIGIPNTGVLTMQDCCKLQPEVNTWGGYLGNYEGTVPGDDGGCCDQPGRWCDNLSNNDPTVFAVVSKATAWVTLQLANRPFNATHP